MSSKKAEKRRLTIFNKMKKMLIFLLVQRRNVPGAKGFELRRIIGTKYPFIANLLNKELETFGLKINIVFQGKVENPTLQDYDRAHFYIVTSDPLVSTPLKGQFNMEELSALSASILYLVSKNNRCSYEDLMNFLNKKISKTKSKRYLDKFIKKGYLEIDENDTIKLGWRTYAEVEIETLLKLVTIYNL